MIGTNLNFGIRLETEPLGDGPSRGFGHCFEGGTTDRSATYLFWRPALASFCLIRKVFCEGYTRSYMFVILGQKREVNDLLTIVVVVGGGGMG